MAQARVPEAEVELTGLDGAQGQHPRRGVLPGLRGGARNLGAVGARRSRRLLKLRDTPRAISQENVDFVRRGLESPDSFWALLDERVVP